MSIIQQPDGATLITGQIADQAALFGLLSRLRDLGMPLLSVNILVTGSNSVHRTMIGRQQLVTVVINAFISFRRKRPANEITEGMRLFPTECDSLLSALEPFRASQAFQVRVYDLETTGGRLRGLLNGVVESPAIIVAGEKHIGLVAVNDALDRMAGNVMIGQAVA